MARVGRLLKRSRRHGPIERPEKVKRTEHEEARRKARDWLRDRDETNAAEFEREEGDELFDWVVGNGWE